MSMLVSTIAADKNTKKERELIHVTVRTDEVLTAAQVFTFFPPEWWIHRAANNTYICGMRNYRQLSVNGNGGITFNYSQLGDISKRSPTHLID